MKKELSAKEKEQLLSILQTRFEKNKDRHKGVSWEKVATRMDAKKLWSLSEMEKSGGEPDVVTLDKKDGLVFCDCSDESPAGRRSFCYDSDALASRKEHKPKNNAVDVAWAMGVELPLTLVPAATILPSHGWISTAQATSFPLIREVVT